MEPILAISNIDSKIRVKADVSNYITRGVLVDNVKTLDLTVEYTFQLEAYI